MTDKKNKKEGLPVQEKSPAENEGNLRVEQGQKAPEAREVLKADKIVSDELRREVEMMELDDSTKAEAEKAKEKIEFLDEKDKIERLLDIARQKGLAFAIQVARKMNEPYLLDVLHDTLAREGFYKDFTK
jgi:hypothetical protein